MRAIALTPPGRACYGSISSQTLVDCFVVGFCPTLASPSSTWTSQKAQLAACVAASHTSQGVTCGDSSAAVFLYPFKA